MHTQARAVLLSRQPFSSCQTDPPSIQVGDVKDGCLILVMDDEEIIRDMATEMLEYQ